MSNDEATQTRTVGGYKIIIQRGRVHSVTIQGPFTGPYINLEVSPDAALKLLKALEANRSEIEDMVKNYWDCPDCGWTHPNSVKICPNIEQ